MTDPHNPYGQNYGQNPGPQYTPGGGINPPPTNPFPPQQGWDTAGRNTQGPPTQGSNTQGWNTPGWDTHSQPTQPAGGPPPSGGVHKGVLITGGIAVAVIIAAVALTVVFTTRGDNSTAAPAASSSSAAPSTEPTIARPAKAIVPAVDELSTILGIQLQGPLDQWTTIDPIGKANPAGCASLISNMEFALGAPESAYQALFGDGPAFGGADNRFRLAVGTYRTPEVAATSYSTYQTNIGRCPVGTVYSSPTDPKLTLKVASASTVGKDFRVVAQQRTNSKGNPSVRWACFYSTRVVSNVLLYAAQCTAGQDSTVKVLDAMEQRAH